MGDLTETLRETELKVSKLLMHKGEYSEDTNAQLFKKSDVYKDLTVGGTTVKAKFAVAVARWFKKNVMNHLVSRVSDKYADKVRELATQVTDLLTLPVAQQTNFKYLEKLMVQTNMKQRYYVWLFRKLQHLVLNFMKLRKEV